MYFNQVGMFNKYKYQVVVLGVLSTLLISCEPEIKQDGSGNGFSGGDANFNKSIAFGGAFLSGFTSNELFRSGQEASVGGIIAQQLRRSGGGAFKQALMFDEAGLGGRKELKLISDCNGIEILKAVSYGIAPDSRNTANIGREGLYNNLAIPHASVADLLSNSFYQSNPYFGRMASVAGTSVIDDAEKLDPTFFFFWAPEEDAYKYAVAGGATGLGAVGLTDVSSYRINLEKLVTRLQVKGAKGMICNIPSITHAPFFNVIPYNCLELTQAEADQLNIFYLYDPNLRFTAGKNPLVVRDGAFNRFAFPDELIPLTIDLDSIKCKGYGSSIPISDQDILTRDEIREIERAIDGYNAAIADLATKYSLGLFDAFQFFERILINGYQVDGISYTGEYIYGGFISPDGIYPTKRGNAILANEIIKVANNKFKAKIPHCDINQFPTVAIP